MTTETKIPRALIIIPIVLGLIVIGLAVYSYGMANKVNRYKLKDLHKKEDSLMAVIALKNLQIQTIEMNAKQAGQSYSKQSEVIANRKIVKKPFVQPADSVMLREINELR